MDNYWVTMTDIYGGYLAGKQVCKIVFECTSLEEAAAIREVARLKPGMRRINIARKKPRYHLENYHTIYHIRENAPQGWYPVKEDKPNEV